MMEPIAKDDLLFHPVHGLCRVSTVTRSVQPKELKYTLLPVVTHRGKIRFVIPASALQTSGFGKLISSADGQAILKYLKTGKNEGPEDSRTWKSAKLIRSESFSRESIKDARRRQQVDRAVKGLVNELAFVLKLTLKDVVKKIANDLCRVSGINPLVANALTKIEQEQSE